jgi:hypothetical protein
MTTLDQFDADEMRVGFACTNVHGAQPAGMIAGGMRGIGIEAIIHVR